MLLSGWANSSTMRCGSVVSKPVMAAAVRLNCGVHGPPTYALIECSTSVATNGRPSWNVTSRRRSRASDRPSGDSCQPVASEGSTVSESRA